MKPYTSIIKDIEAMASVVAGPSEPSVVHDGSIEREIDPEEVRC